MLSITCTKRLFIKKTVSLSREEHLLCLHVHTAHTHHFKWRPLTLFYKLLYNFALFWTGTPVDPMEGNPMWKYLQNSLESSEPWVEKPKQLPRKVSYNSKLFYDVRPDETYKLMYTPAALPNFYIRKWAPIWPTDDEVIPDFGYISIMPCRPEGGDKPQKCCLFKVSDDSGEDDPMVVTESECEDYASEAHELYIGAGDPKTSVAKACSKYHPTMGCKENSDGYLVPAGQTLLSNKGADQAMYSLWTQCESFLKVANSVPLLSFNICSHHFCLSFHVQMVPLAHGSRTTLRRKRQLQLYTQQPSVSAKSSILTSRQEMSTHSFQPISLHPSVSA